jgi:hypothetical protein
MGIDVGRNFDVRVSAIEGFNRRCVFAGKVKNVEDLLDIAIRYNVEVAVIDAMPEAIVSQEFQDSMAQLGKAAWLCRYGSEGDSKKIKRDMNDRVLTVDRTAVLDRALQKIKGGRNFLPTNYKALAGGNYVHEMTSSVRKVEQDAKGNTRFIWTKTEDHQRHADVYDMLAAEMMIALELSLDMVSVG